MSPEVGFIWVGSTEKDKWTRVVRKRGRIERTSDHRDQMKLSPELTVVIGSGV